MRHRKFHRRHRRHKKKLMKNPLRKGVPNYKRLMRLTIMATIPITASGTPAANTAEYPQLSLALNFPCHGAYYDGNSSTAYNIISSLPGGAVASVYSTFFTSGFLFDEYRVVSLNVRFLANTQLTNSIGTTITVTDQNMLYHYNDPDDTTLVTSNIEQNYLDAGVLPLTVNNTSKSGINFVYKQKPEVKHLWLNANGIAQSPSASPSASNTPFPNPFGSMKLCWKTTSNGSSTGQLGQIFASWDCMFRGLDFLG